MATIILNDGRTYHNVQVEDEIMVLSSDGLFQYYGKFKGHIVRFFNNVFIEVPLDSLKGAIIVDC